MNGPSQSPRRAAVVARLADLVLQRRRPGSVLRMGVDGVDGAGKTVLADELGRELVGRGVEVLRASVDGFHHPAAVRYRRGRGSPEGFYQDSYDYAALRRELLDPLGPDGDRWYRTAVHDVSSDEPVEVGALEAAPGSVLVLDGIFLHRPELRDAWDVSVFVRVDVAVSVPRGAQRGYGHPDPADPSNRRYVLGQRIYLAACHPERLADAVLDNTDLARPVLLTRCVGTGPGTHARAVAAPSLPRSR